MDVKYQIFISSTYKDLIEERDAVTAAILKIGHIPIGMEMFKAEDINSWEVIKRTIESADYYVVIVGHRYGSITKSGKSFTEMEYDYAIKLKIPTLAFIIDETAERQINQIEDDEDKRKKLYSFKEKLKKKNMDTWKNSSELSYKLTVSLANQFNINPRQGWIKNDKSYFNSIEELTRLSKENSELREQIIELEEQTKDVSRKPLLKVSFSEELNFKIQIPKKRVRTEKPVVDVEWSERINNENYNRRLSSQDQYDKYNTENYIFEYAKLNSKQIKISINNNGNIKATLVEIIILLPKEIAVIPSKNFINVPYNSRFDEQNGENDEFMDQKMQPIQLSKLGSLYNFGDEWYINYRYIQYKRDTFIHTKQQINDITLLPLKKGEYNIEVKYLCDEYPEKIIEKIPVKID